VRYNGPEEAAAVYAEIETAIAIEREAGVARWTDAFRPGPQALRYRTFLGMGALFAQQCTGVVRVDACLADLAYADFDFDLRDLLPLSPSVRRTSSRTVRLTRFEECS
jgi:hypothetical protein